VFEEEKAMIARIEKEKEELLVKTKKVIYPFYLLGGTLMAILWYGQHLQDNLIKDNAKKLKH
jgi:hypothetical protein